MDRTLHDAQNAKKILQITADTMILVDQDGTCVDIDTHSNLWFLQEEKLLGKTYLIYCLCILVRSWSRFSGRL